MLVKILKSLTTLQMLRIENNLKDMKICKGTLYFTVKDDLERKGK